MAWGFGVAQQGELGFWVVAPSSGYMCVGPSVVRTRQSCSWATQPFWHEIIPLPFIAVPDGVLVSSPQHLPLWPQVDTQAAWG